MLSHEEKKIKLKQKGALLMKTLENEVDGRTLRAVNFRLEKGETAHHISKALGISFSLVKQHVKAHPQLISESEIRTIQPKVKVHKNGTCALGVEDALSQVKQILTGDTYGTEEKILFLSKLYKAVEEFGHEQKTDEEFPDGEN